MAHLGERVAALVDGQLPPDATERAHVHLAHCRECRDAVEAERLMKVRLAALQGPRPGDDLMKRLLAMGGPNGPLPPRTGHVPGSPRPQEVALPRTPVPVAALASSAAGGRGLVRPALASGAVVPAPTRRRGLRTAGRSGPAVSRATSAAGAPAGTRGPGRSRAGRRRTRLAVAVFGALSVVGVGITSMAANGAVGSAVSPTVVPPVDSFVVDHARTTGTLPFVDVPAGWQLVQADQGGGADK